MALEIKSIRQNSPLHEHHIKQGDLIAKINGVEVSYESDIGDIRREKAVDIEIVRDHDRVTISTDADDLGLEVFDRDKRVFVLESWPQSQSDSTRETLNQKGYAPREYVAPTTNEQTSMMLIVSWTILVINLIGSVFLFTRFGYEVVISPSGLSHSEQLNVELLAVIIVSILGSVFLVSLSSLLVNYRRQFERIEHVLSDISKKI